MRTLAECAVNVCNRTVDDHSTAAAMSVPRDALVAIGTFDPITSEILLTGDQSAAAVVEWLDMRRFDPSELRPGLEHPLTVMRFAADAEVKVVVNRQPRPPRRLGPRQAGAAAATGMVARR
jgi:hypothetical protein